MTDKKATDKHSSPAVKLLMVAFFMAMLIGCDPVVNTRTIGESHNEERAESCTHFSYCFTCMPGFNGKTDCSFKASALCPGTRRVELKLTPVELTCKSGNVEKSFDSQVVREISSCQ